MLVSFLALLPTVLVSSDIYISLILRPGLLLISLLACTFRYAPSLETSGSQLMSLESPSANEASYMKASYSYSRFCVHHLLHAESLRRVAALPLPAARYANASEIQLRSLCSLSLAAGQRRRRKRAQLSTMRIRQPVRAYRCVRDACILARGLTGRKDEQDAGVSGAAENPSWIGFEQRSEIRGSVRSARWVAERSDRGGVSQSEAIGEGPPDEERDRRERSA